MKQCPTCGHRTNDDVCPVCGAATVVLQNDPQEKAQRTIQYQRFDPSKAPGATASGQAVQTGHRYIQKDPGATHQMQQGAGMTPPQRNQQPHPANQPPQSWRNADQQQTAETAKRAQQENADSSRNITYQHTDGFHPTTLPRRSQKYRQKYATYMPAEPAGADPAGSGIPTEPVVSKPSGSGVPAETVVPQPAEEIGAKIPAGMEPQQAPPADPAKPAVADPAGSEIPVEADGRHIQQANPITEEAAPGSEPATAHGLLSPEELEEFLGHIDRKFDSSRMDLRGEKVYYMPEGLPTLRGIRFLRTGLLMGELKKNRFEPSQALAMNLKKEEYDQVIDLPLEDERVMKYLKGETLDVEDLVKPKDKGWYLICVDGYPLGFGKLVNQMLKNKYLPGWRWNS